ncbi:MAG TPA: hypothetical protein VH853_06585 [Polyangia bacterium]|nr:hypothetical protein [Polyangia bacterium]
MGVRMVLALGLALALVLGAEVGAPRADSRQPADNSDGGAPLVVMPNSSSGAPATANTPTEPPGAPPPRSLDSKRAPVPDRLALPDSMQDVPLAPPTPPIPDNSGASKKAGGGANRTSQFVRNGFGGAPPDLPRDSVTRTPEDQLAPPSSPPQGPR